MPATPRIAANLSFLFTEYPFLERFDRAADAGFTGVEFLFPYDHPATVLRETLTRNGLDLVLFDVPLGDFAAGERGIAAIPERAAEFTAGVEEAADYAAALQTPLVNSPSGAAPHSPIALQTLIANLRAASATLGAVGVGLVIEPMNAHDLPGALIDTTARARWVVEQVGHPNLGIQYDLYHSMRAGENPYAMLDEHLPLIRHIQIADVPGRHQPGTGDVDFDRFFGVLAAAGYPGWVSLEYRPDGPTMQSFEYFRAAGLLGRQSSG